jgi:hypothetical protein
MKNRFTPPLFTFKKRLTNLIKKNKKEISLNCIFIDQLELPSKTCPHSNDRPPDPPPAKPIDGKGEIIASESRLTESPAPSIISRRLGE